MHSGKVTVMGRAMHGYKRVLRQYHYRLTILTIELPLGRGHHTVQLNVKYFNLSLLAIADYFDTVQP